MMRAPDGRAFTRTGQQKVNRDLQKNAGILSRRSVAMPKQPKPAPAGGGIIGQASASSSALRPRGFSGGEFWGWSFADEVGQPLGLNDALDPGGKGFTAPPGWYSAKVYVDLTLGPQPSPIVVQVNEAAGTLAYSELTWVPGGGRWAHTGVFWLPEAYMYPRLGVTVHCESGIPGDTVGNCNYYLTRHA